MLENVKINGATGIIINVTGGSDLSLYEVDEAAQLIINSASEEAEVIFGAVIDSTLTDEIRVTVIATGFNHEEKREGITPFNNMQNFLQPNTGVQMQAQPQQQMAQPQYQQPQGFQYQSAYQQPQVQPAFQAPQQQFQQPAYNPYQQQQVAQPQVAPVMPQVMMPPAVENTLPSINNVQESIKSFANEVTQQEVQAEEFNTFEPEMQTADLTTEVSPVAAAATTARDMLLAKAKAFRETQISQVVTQDKGIHPEQLTMMDEEKHFEEARKMARDILEVPAFIRKKQGADLQN